MPEWVSYILFAVFFYFMMRHGCGSHMVHGHGKKKNESENDIDPVCKNKINDKQGYGKMHGNQLYRFCSRKCLDEFEHNPDKYIR